jgi:altronate dehydratase
MRSDSNFRYMTIQQSGGTRKTIERALEQLKEMAARSPMQERPCARRASNI